MVNSPLIRPYFLGGWHWGGTLDSHESSCISTMMPGVAQTLEGKNKRGDHKHYPQNYPFKRKNLQNCTSPPPKKKNLQVILAKNKKYPAQNIFFPSKRTHKSTESTDSVGNRHVWQLRVAGALSRLRRISGKSAIF